MNEQPAHPPLPDRPDPAEEALERPPLPAEKLEEEIGDSETWDEASDGPQSS